MICAVVPSPEISLSTHQPHPSARVQRSHDLRCRHCASRCSSSSRAAFAGRSYGSARGGDDGRGSAAIAAGVKKWSTTMAAAASLILSTQRSLPRFSPVFPSPIYFLQYSTVPYYQIDQIQIIIDALSLGDASHLKVGSLQRLSRYIIVQSYSPYCILIL